MSIFPTPKAIGPQLILLAAIIGTAVSLYNYVTPLTGINGSPGALLVLVASVLLILDALVLWLGPPGAVFGLFWALGLLGALGTITAGWFLHASWLMVAMAVVFIGLVVALLPSRKLS